MPKISLALVYIGLSFLLAACSAYKINIKASSDDNKNIHNQPSSLAINVYQLSSKHGFYTAGLQQEFFKPKEVFVHNLLQTTNLYLQPGHLLHLNIQLKKHSKYLGVVADYRSNDKLAWHKLINLQAYNAYLGGTVSLVFSSRGIKVD